MKIKSRMRPLIPTTKKGMLFWLVDGHHRNLEKHGFRPVWTSRNGYPGDLIPEDIDEWLDENWQCKSVRMTGPLRSLAWLAGLDELVQAIDHPAYVIEDDIEIVPFGANLMWPLERHMEEGTLPPTIWAKASGNNSLVLPSPMATNVPATLPTAVKDTLKTHNLRGLYRDSRIEATRTIECTEIKFEKKLDRLEVNIRKLVGAPLESQNLWFRGLTLDALESTLAFFIPERNSHNCDNEFGPGFYTTDRLNRTLPYVRSGGAIMVFKDPDLHNTRLWEPNLEVWNSLVARWRCLPLEIAQQQTPEEFYGADITIGPISGEEEDVRGGHGVPVQSDANQLVACSYGGCKALSDSLRMIIFIARG